MRAVELKTRAVELIGVTFDSRTQCICHTWTGQESKAGRVRPPAAGYITISLGSEVKVGALEGHISRTALQSGFKRQN